MPDMLVKLYNLKPDQDLLDKLTVEDIYIKRVIAPELSVVTDWVREHFNKTWANECAVAIGNTPSTCFVAYKDRKILGFACCEATAPNFFGPTGVHESVRGKGVGKALLYAALEHQKAMGYAYSIIGGTDSANGFYAKCCGAVVIEDSVPGIYKHMVKG